MQELPANLAEALERRIGRFAAAEYIEIDWFGRRLSASLDSLFIRAKQYAAEIQECAPGPDTDILLCFEDALDFVPAFWACVLAGFPCLPVQFHHSELTSAHPASRLHSVREKLHHPLLLTTRRLKEHLGEHMPAFPGVLSFDRRAMVRDSVDPSRFAAGAKDFGQRQSTVLIATSGTTGGAKLAMIGERALLRRMQSLDEHSVPRRLLHLQPFDRVAGVWFALRPHHANIYVQPARIAARPGELVSLIEEFRIEGIALTSSLAARVCDAAERGGGNVDLSSLKHVAFGAEMIVPAVVRKLADFAARRGARDLKISFGYGMTETGLICRTPEQSVTETLTQLDGEAPPKLGPCVGGWSLRIVDDNGLPSPGRAAGHIEVWSKQALFSGYRGEAELSAQSFAPDGWFKTGDRGVLEDGELRIVGREKATIIINGRTISLEEIEAPLRGIEGVKSALLAAAPVRLADSTTDELAVFFVPQSTDAPAIDALCRSIVGTATRTIGIRVSHLVPLTETEVPLTATGKMKRSELVERLLDGTSKPRQPQRTVGHAGHDTARNLQAGLQEIWRSVLQLDFLPAPTEDFFELGGDSLASAELVAAVEEKFGATFPVEEFFREPTLETLAALVAKATNAPPPPRSAEPTLGAAELLSKLRSYTASWKGERLFPESLVVGLNTDGKNSPLFWVFQNYNEFAALAQALGRDQPVYGLRSCVRIVAARDYPTIIEAVCDRYLWEILALPLGGPTVIGGNCQGGMIALHLARRLNLTPRAPSLLVLLEWIYDFGTYDQPALLIYGEQSHTAGYYTGEKPAPFDWRRDFPCGSILPIAGKHGEFFGPERVTGLADILRERPEFQPSTSEIPDRSRRSTTNRVTTN
jgi:acyl-CoA synthetase (AMP-forming)/AMP-acid ligase II/acyl carrier protein